MNHLFQFLFPSLLQEILGQGLLDLFHNSFQTKWPIFKNVSPPNTTSLLKF